MNKYKFIDINRVYRSSDDMFRVLDINGDLIDKKYNQNVDNETLIKGYSYMVKSRKQDEYMSQLQKQGRMLTFAPNFGEEALQVATAMAMKDGDYFVPAFRSNATMLYLGVPLKSQLLYWNGNEMGSKYPEGVNVLPINIPIATQYSHAAGIAYGMKVKGEKNVAVTFIGNGGTAEGEFYESMNIASIHKWPVVFCVNNNQWAISTRNKDQVASDTIAAKAVAVGIPGIRVDGNDLLGSYDVINEAIEYVREGNGPILVEFVTWREGKHTTSDDPSIYRTREEEIEHEKWEPFHRIEKYLIDTKIMTQDNIDSMKESALEEVKDAYQESLKDIEVSVDEVFDYTYEKLDPDLIAQKNEAKAIFEKGGK